RQGCERVVSRGSRRGRGDRRHDAAAVAGDIGISPAVEAPLEFTGPIARVDEMRMTVDEAGGQPPPPGASRLERHAIPGYIARVADPRDQAAADCHGAVADRAI